MSKIELLSQGFEPLPKASFWLSTLDKSNCTVLMSDVVNDNGLVIMSYDYWSTSLYISYFEDEATTINKYGASMRVGPYHGVRIFNPGKMGIAAIYLNNAVPEIAEVLFWTMPPKKRPFLPNIPNIPTI